MLDSVARMNLPRIAGTETVTVVWDTFRGNKLRTLFIALGMMIGTASLVLVVAVALTGKEYIVRQIQSIGANMIDAEYQGGGEEASPDRLTIEDLYAVRQRVFGVVAASPVLQLDNRIPIGGGRERDVRLLGVLPEYLSVRNLIVSGRFFDRQDEQSRNKVAVLEGQLATELFGSTEAAIGKELRLNNLPFTVIGTFRESVDTFGQSEVTDNCLLIPYSVARYFKDTPEVEQIYFSTADPSTINPLTDQIRNVIQSRHRPGSNYIVQNLTAVIQVADRTADALTMMLLLISAITLLVSGIGIMNIMLATVNSRIYEIGIRKAVGATNSEIRFQFLAEAVLISVVGGLCGVAIGLILPWMAQLLIHYRIPSSGWSAVIALLASASIGILFGTLPANRAARLDPAESLRHE